MKSQTLRTYMIMSLVLTLFLLLSLIFLNTLSLFPSSDDLIIMQQANFQLARNEFISKDVMVLAYRPSTYHSQAINELQTILPQFQLVQVGLLQGNAVLGLPGRPPDSVKVALLSTQSDYLAIVTAVNHLLAHPDVLNPDPVQVEIVLQHERFYISGMYQVISLLQQDAETRRVQLIMIKLTILGATGVTVVLKYTLFTRFALKGMERAEKMKETKEPPQ